MPHKKKVSAEETATRLSTLPYAMSAKGLLEMEAENPSFAWDVAHFAIKDMVPTLEGMSFGDSLLFEKTMDEIKEIHPNLYRTIREELDVRYMLRIVKEAEDGKEAWYHMLDAFNNQHLDLVFRAMDRLRK